MSGPRIETWLERFGRRVEEHRRARRPVMVLDGRFEILTRREFHQQTAADQPQLPTTMGTCASPLANQRGPVGKVG